LRIPHPAPDQLQERLEKEKAYLVWQALKEMPKEQGIQVGGQAARRPTHTQAENARFSTPTVTQSGGIAV